MYGLARTLVFGIATTALAGSTFGAVTPFKTGVDVNADSLDDNFTVLVHSGMGPINPTAADFLAARNSSQQSFILPLPPTFLPDHPDPTVEFLGSNPDSHLIKPNPSMLNAISLVVPNIPIRSATLDFVIHTDDGTNVYLNEQFVVTPFGGTATVSVDVTSTTVPGQNYLYLETINGISQTGTAVSGTLTTTHDVPEPGSLVVFAGLALIASVWEYRRKLESVAVLESNEL